MNNISNDVRNTLRGKKDNGINSKRVREAEALGWVYMSKVLDSLGDKICTKQFVRHGNKVKRATLEESKMLEEREKRVMNLINSLDVVEPRKAIVNLGIGMSAKSLGKLLRRMGWKSKIVHGRRIWINPNHPNHPNPNHNLNPNPYLNHGTSQGINQSCSPRLSHSLNPNYSPNYSSRA